MGNIILLDFEATDLLSPTAMPLESQPHVTEVGALALDPESLDVVAEFSSLVNPGIPIPEQSKKITGITDEMVADAPSFAALYPRMVDFFLGAETLVAHNLTYDRGVLAGELQRLGKLLEFPWPPRHVCTVELTELFEGKNLRQEYLYEKVIGRPADQTHRALDDVKQLYEIVQWLRSPTPIEGWDVDDEPYI